MESFKSLLLTFTLCALFAFAIFNFSVKMQTDNNVTSTVLSDPRLSALNDSLASNINNLSSSSTDYYNATDSNQKNQEIPTGALSVSSIFNSLMTFSGFIFGFFAVIVNLISSMLGIDAIFLTTLTAALVIVAVILWWRMIKIGQ